jgi:hypothetical protein
MANFIDIKDFEGALTNADLEDLPDNVAQEIKNLKIEAGRLKKTFGAGVSSATPSFGLTLVNNATSPADTYVVYNIYTFISDKFEMGSSSSNDAGDGFRYLLVTINDSNKVKLWWYDYSLPDVNDHLQVENDILWFQTASAHGFVEDDYVLVQNCKDNASPQASISGAGVYERADVVPSTTKIGINTDTARTWGGGNFFETTLPTGASTKGWGGKHSAHVQVDESVDFGGTDWSSVQEIAIAPMSSSVGRVLSIAKNGTELAYCSTGSSYADLSETNYNTYKTKTNFTICGLIGFNEGIYIHYSYQDSGNYNYLVKYTCDASGNVSEGTPITLSTSALCSKSYMTIANGNLYFIAVGLNVLYKITTSDSASVISTTGIAVIDAKGLTSLIQTNNLNANGTTSVGEVNHEYLTIVVTSSSANTNVYTLDILSGETSWATWGTTLANTTVQQVTKMDFGENSNKSESLVLWYIGASSRKYLQYSTHNSTTVINTINTDVSSSTFGVAVDIAFIDKAYNIPSGTKYLIVGTNNAVDGGGNATDSGILYRVNSSKTVEVMIDPGTSSGKTNWNPTCFADCATPQNFFTHAKAWIGVYGTEAQDASANESADVYKMSDIGWYANTWNGSGDCDYRWIDIASRYSLATSYHKKDRNPIIPFGDTLRVLPGSIAKIGSNEAKGAWLGYIDRSLFNGSTVYGPDWFVEQNRLTNPFTFKNVELNLTDEEIRSSDTVKYTVTAIYDGVQETQIDDDAIKRVVANTGDDDNVSKSEIKLVLDLPISTMSKRITGINVYRAEKISGIYETYKLITSYTFVDTDVTSTTSADAELIMNFEVFNDKTFFIKDQENAIKNWLNDGTVQNLTSDQNSITDNNYYAYSSPNWKYAIKVGSFTKQHIETISAITGYDPTGATLNEDLTAIDSTITVNNVSNITNSTVYKIGQRDLSIGTSVGHEDDDADDYERIQVTGISGNNLTVTRGYPNYTVTGVSYTNEGTTITHSANGSIAVGHIINDGTGPTGVPSGATIVSITDSTHFVIDRPVTASQSSQTLTVLTNAKEHSKYTSIKADTATITGWYKFVTDDNIKGRMHDDSWKIYKAKIPGPAPGGWNTQIGTKSVGAFAGKYMAIIIPQPSEDSNGDFTMAPWRDTDGTMKLSSILAKKFTATKPSSTSKTFKIEKVYTTFDEQLGFTFIEVDKGPQSANWVDGEVIVSTFADVSAVVSTDVNEISIIDKGLSSLGEHPYGQEKKIKINAQFGKILKGRLFLGNLVLDPGSKNEEQNDWVAYSELNAYDVRPVSNVIPFPDREGGQITGLSEIFGRLVVFKAQAIYVLDIVDPATPTTWRRKESKINIGNIAPEGIVEIHDSVFFVHHDGIYKLDANTVASADATPSIMEKISLPIEDQFDSAISKKDIKGIYNQKDNELLYTWDIGSPATQVVWAYHIVLKTWRKVDTFTNLDLLTFGENSGPITWDNTDTDIKKFDVDEAVGTVWKSKKFRLDLDNKKLLRYGMVQFTGTDTLTVNVYLDGSGSASFTKTITADGGVNRFPIKRYGKNFEIELTTPTSTNAFSVERMRIETE